MQNILKVKGVMGNMPRAQVAFSTFLIASPLLSSLPLTELLSFIVAFFIVIIGNYRIPNLVTIPRIFAKWLVILAVILCYSLILIDFSNIDKTFYEYFIRSSYKELFVPALFIYLFAIFKIQFSEFIKSYKVAFVATAILALILPGFSPLGLLFVFGLTRSICKGGGLARFVWLGGAGLYLLLVVLGDLYFSSQLIFMTFLALVFLVVLFGNVWLIIPVVVFAAAAMNLDTIYEFLLSSGIKANYVFRFLQFFIVISWDAQPLPWSPHVRIIEFQNALTHPLFFNIFGNGIYSYITDEIYEFGTSTRSLGLDDFSVGELQDGQFFGLHNFSRGFLHYGFLYYILILFFASRVWRHNDLEPNEKAFFAVLLAVACWNPYIHHLVALDIFSKELRTKSSNTATI